MQNTRPSFTALDPRARIRGSRDPLGLQPVWTAFGRQVVLNLTTVSSSLRNFTTLLLARYFADRAREEGIISLEGYLPAFLKVEQLCAYSRVAYRPENSELDEDEIRGIQRVSKRLLDGEIRISGREKWQILSDQKTYGLWGLYTVASARSGLVEEDHSRLSAIARDFVETQYVPRIPEKGKSLLAYLEKDDREFVPRSKDKKLATALAEIHGQSISKAEQELYTHHLLHSGDDNSLQARAWKQIRSLNSRNGFPLQAPFSQPELVELVKRTAKTEQELSHRFENIGVVEAYFAPLDYLFSFLLDRDTQPLNDVAGELDSAWGKKPIRVSPQQFAEALDHVTTDSSQELIANLKNMAQLLSSGQYAELIKLLLVHNKLVMTERGAGEAWVAIEYGKLHVRLRELNPKLPEKKSLATLWKNSYFINALKSVGYHIVRGSAS